MKIRLILPICRKLVQRQKKNKKWYCLESKDNHAKRLEIIQNAMNYNATNVDLVVTSNNFFEFDNKNLAKKYLNKLPINNNLILGIDITKGTNKFNGIKSMVIFFDKNKSCEKLSIWEVWNPKVKKNKTTWNAFSSQSRIIEIKNNTICLLSCGDILAPVHNSGVKLSNSSIYIDLAHMNFSNYSINHSKDLSWIQQWKGQEKIVLVTQQISDTKLFHGHFFQDEKYQLIYPNTIKQSQNIQYFDHTHKLVDNDNIDYIFVDVEIGDKE